MCYICNDCRSKINEGEFAHRTECIGEFWGSPAYQDYPVCPECGSDDIADGVVCPVCGECFPEEEAEYGVCEECLHSRDDDWEFWYNTCAQQNETVSVDINAVLAALFTPEQINEILARELREADEIAPGVVNCKDFVNEDKGWSSDMLAREEERHD